MKKEAIQKTVIGLVVGASLLSFVYVNFVAGNAGGQPVSSKGVSKPQVESAKFDKDDDESPKSGTPSIAVFARIFTLAKKFVPSGQ